MPDLPLETPKILALYLQIAQYPVLARQIRQRMRQELYSRGVITQSTFEFEARAKAIDSQHREGLSNPYAEENESTWEQRLQTVRDNLTDFYFAYNLPLDLFNHIVHELINERAAEPQAEMHLTFNPELAPVDLLLRQVRLYEALPEAERAKVSHHLEEIVVVLVRTIISDQLSFVRVAKQWFTATDFEFIRSRRIGSGKIGGKAAGMLLAWKILHQAAPDLAAHVSLPPSYFVGANVFYDFKALNQLDHNQKYKSTEEIRAEYDQIVQGHLQARFPEEVADRLREILDDVGPAPLIVRSSSLLEDSFGTSFAGKYSSYFCANQGSPKENLRDLTVAIRRVYASVYNPDVLIYRRRMGLLDYDERMAILLQVVQGEQHGRLFFPDLAGVAFSQSPIVWSPRLRREEGFIRMVLGLGTRAVERVGEDYPRLVFLSHPNLRPESSPDSIAHYSQHMVDVIDLDANSVATRPVSNTLTLDYPALAWVASLQDPQAETLLPLRSLGPQVSPERLVLTFDNLLQRTDFVPLMRRALATLSRHYEQPVDLEFAATLVPPPTGSGRPDVRLHLLQCRPQSSLRGTKVRPLPMNLPAEDKLFYTTRMVPQAEVRDIDYLIYVDPVRYNHCGGPAQRLEVARLVGRINKALEGRTFLLMGPGRWGSSNVQLGVPVSYADIYNARALVEVAVGTDGLSPDPSYGTHFFQDLVESQIYSLAVQADGPNHAAGEFLNWDFLNKSADHLASLLPEAPLMDCLKLIDVAAERSGQRLQLLMDGEKALAFFEMPGGL
jgi:Pyruvate phosphate dikinase, AMP/ATP-binding domain